MEERDLYDIDGNLTGETIYKGEPIPDGKYIAVALCFIQNSKGDFLIQKRSALKNGKYGSTSGHLETGESSIQGMIREIKEELKGKITLFSGHSGVGKSTLINAILPEVNLKTGEISTAHNKGMHTTTFSEMFPVEGNGYIIDTPGIKGFGTFDMKDEEIGHYFKEIFEFSAHCKYGNCTHRHEPGCAVREAVENHYISESRYTSYLNILEDREEGKYRAAY